MFVRRLRPGDDLPAWYYGYAYHDPTCARIVFLPMPLCFVIRAGVRIREAWNRFRVSGLDLEP